MPALKDQRQELFAQERVKGKTLDDSYISAGYKPNRSNAATLNAKKHIRERIQELNARKVTTVVLTRQYVLEALIDTWEKARGLKTVKLGKISTAEETLIFEGSVAVACAKLAGQELGMFVERKDHRITTEFDKMSNADLAKYVAQSAQKLLEHDAAQEIDGEFTEVDDG